MKNLELWNISVKNLGFNLGKKDTICHGHGDGKSLSDVFVCGSNLILNNFDENGKKKWSKDVSEHISPENSPVNISYLSLQNSLCLGFENGELLTIDNTGTTCETVGIFDSGLQAMEWSPDQELLAIVTKELSMVLLSCTYDPINEIKLHNQEFGEKEFITVGWGKKETQFHGSEGKQAAKTKIDTLDDDQTIDSKVRITWRGDGELFAVGFAMNGMRHFKVFDREGHLLYTSEKHKGVEANIAWRPTGNVIATTQKLPDQYKVTFFEKNGLKHRDFKIAVRQETNVENILWSSDSEILILQCEDTETNTQKLLLYTTTNCHWYLKQTLQFRSDQKINKIMWDNDFDVTNNKKLHIILQNGTYLIYSWIWKVHHSISSTDNDDAVVTVVDGNKLLVTGFRQTVVPPPMSAVELNLESNAQTVCFAPNDENVDPNTFFVLTTDNKLVFYAQRQKYPLKYETYYVQDIDVPDLPFQYHHWHWATSNTVLCIMTDEKSSYLIEMNKINEKFVKCNTTKLEESVTQIQSHPTNKELLFLQSVNGQIFSYNVGGLLTNNDISFKVACPRFDILSIENIIHFIGLSHKGNLFLDDKQIFSNVSSYFINSDFVLLTTLQHLLLCVDKTQFGLTALMEHQKNESDHVYKRKIERGSKLVIVVPNDTRTILQMPRGNLEAIQPRPLSLKIIGKYLDNFKYFESFDLMRKQRINLNLIYDHDPKKFLANINRFLDSINNSSWLNLFLSDLENVDVTKTMYSSIYAERPTTTNDSSKKIEIVCREFRSHIENRSDKATKILPLLTTYVKKNTVGDLEKALEILKDLKNQESTGEKIPVSSDEALKYLLYMVDVSQLFDIALGMYDFELVLLVANKSQKDPKEYIPMLNELNEMDENYKRFTINKQLKRFDKAVQSLVLCGPTRHSELITFVKYHSLYQEALRHFSVEEEIFRQISEDYGQHLKLKKYYTEAGIVYEKANSNDKAIECYKEALEWELAIKLAYSWPKAQFKELCWDLINSLKQENRHSEALIILEQFYDDIDECINYAIGTNCYKKALRFCSQYNKLHLKEERLKPAILDEYQNVTYLIETNRSMFIKHRDRLSQVREIKKNEPVDQFDIYNNKDTDLYSDAGSTLASSSRGSSRSHRSSKNRRKHERKIASLKEGSQYEDIGLIIALHGLITSTFDLRIQVRDTVIGLSCLSKDKEAYILQRSLEKLLKEMKDSFKDIWTNEFMLEATKATIAAQNMTEDSGALPPGVASLDLHLRIPPVIQEINWKLEGLN